MFTTVTGAALPPSGSEAVTGETGTLRTNVPTLSGEFGLGGW